MAADLSPADFWSMGLPEFSAVMAGAEQRELRRFNHQIAAAYLGARLQAYHPAKARDFPKLERFLLGENGAAKPKARQTWEQQLAITSAW